MKEWRVLQRLNTRLADARQLVDFHTVITGTGRGRRYDVDALNRGAVILSVAAWEAFNEDLAMRSAYFFSHRVRSEEDVPEGIKSSLLVWVYKNGEFKYPTPRAQEAMWSLTGEGWRTQLREFIKCRVAETSNPGPKEIRKLFKDVLDIDDVTESWAYHRWGADVYREKLNSTLLLRHRIAHGTIGTETVGKMRARAAIDLVANLAQRSVRAVDKNFERFDLIPRKRKRRKKRRP